MYWLMNPPHRQSRCFGPRAIRKKCEQYYATHIHQSLSLPCWLVPCYMRVSRAYMYWIIMLLCAPLPLASCVSLFVFALQRAYMRALFIAK